MNIHALPPATFISFAGIAVDDNRAAVFAYTGQKLQLFVSNGPDAGGALGTPLTKEPRLDVWTMVRMELDLDTGAVSLWLDGVLSASSPGLALQPTDKALGAGVGPTVFEASGAMEVFFDDVTIDVR